MDENTNIIVTALYCVHDAEYELIGEIVPFSCVQFLYQVKA